MELIDFVVDYNETIRERKVLPDVEPGYLAPLLPDEAPVERDSWSQVFQDVHKCIIPGVSS